MLWLFGTVSEIKFQKIFLNYKNRKGYNPMARLNQDMGTGKITRWMVQLAVPAICGQLVNMLYNIVDRIYIGHIPEVGADALTGVGLFTAILMLITAFAMLCGAGGAPRAAIAMGKGDKDTAEKIVGNCFTVLMILSVILTAVFYFAAPSLLDWFGGSPDTLPYAITYARIYVLGSVFVLTVMGMNPFITTQGFAKFSMLTTVIGAGINIVLDPLFIFVFDMGVAGAAVATVLSQAVSAVWILRFLTGKRTILKLKKENLKLQGSFIGPCLALGISSFVMISTDSILSISFTSSLSRYGGDIAVGAMTVLTSINMLVGSSRLSFADPQYMEEYLDITPGSVSVLGLMNDKDNHVQLVIDEDVLKGDFFGCHPCINTSSLRLSTKDLMEKIIPAMHHEPMFVALPEA